MPRINVEDTWFDDPRREALAAQVGGIVADGLALRLWRLAQTYHRTGALIPATVFDKFPHCLELLSVGLAELHEGGIYVKGKSDHFKWLDAKREAGAKGGLAKASKPKQPLADASKPKQTLGSSSSSASSSGSKKNPSIQQRTDFEKFSKGNGAGTQSGAVIINHPMLDEFIRLVEGKEGKPFDRNSELCKPLLSDLNQGYAAETSGLTSDNKQLVTQANQHFSQQIQHIADLEASVSELNKQFKDFSVTDVCWQRAIAQVESDPLYQGINLKPHNFKFIAEFRALNAVQQLLKGLSKDKAEGERAKLKALREKHSYPAIYAAAVHLKANPPKKGEPVKFLFAYLAAETTMENILAEVNRSAASSTKGDAKQKIHELTEKILAELVELGRVHLPAFESVYSTKVDRKRIYRAMYPRAAHWFRGGPALFMRELAAGVWVYLSEMGELDESVKGDEWASTPFDQDEDAPQVQTAEEIRALIDERLSSVASALVG